MILTIDFETYYSPTFSLSKMTTEEYIRSPDFEVIGVAVQVDDGEPEWFSGDALGTYAFLQRYDWANSIAIAHNAMFDGAILNWVYGIRPKGWIDTLSMARAIHGTEVGGSLKVLAEHYEIGVKGTEVVNALGLKRDEFDPEPLVLYGDYCKNDVALTWKLFRAMSDFPAVELRLIDLTIRMFTEPVLQLDRLELTAHLLRVKARKLEVLGKFDKAVLMSNPKFAEELLKLGATPPMKVSPANGSQTYAFSKTDEEFKALLEHENVGVQALVAARLGTKSTIEETRTERFIGIASRGPLPVPLRYYAAHTGRWGGDDKLNLQNLPRGSLLKTCILAPEGYVILDSDSSQIEARTLAWLAGEDGLVEAFENGEDVYRIMASRIYSKPEYEITKDERFVGKTTILGCISAGTLVLCGSGWKPIEQVTADDKLWDGEEWVCHRGLQNSGIKETLNLCGIWLTPDHRVWSGTQWLEAQSVVADAATLSLVLDAAVGNLPLQDTYGAYGVESPLWWLNANVMVSNTQLTSRTSRTLGVHAAPCARRKPLPLSGTGPTLKHWLMTVTGLDYLTGCLRQSHAATTPVVASTKTTAAGVYTYSKSGAMTGCRFLYMYKRLADGITQALKWIGSTTAKDMSRETYDSLPEVRTCETSAGLAPLRRKLQTYDIAYSGPRNRYMILTDKGPMIVHNCGYGMGGVRFQAQLKTFGVTIEVDECKRIINTYRNTYEWITKLWGEASKALDAMLEDKHTTIGVRGVLKVDGKKGILLPNGLRLKYPNLRIRQDEETGKNELVYDTKKGKAVIPTRIYGGKVIENVCQALARIIIGDQMLIVNKKYRVVMTVHDAIACVVPKAEADTAKEYIEMCMRLRPSWALDLPLNCEAGYGESYGDC